MTGHYWTDRHTNGSIELRRRKPTVYASFEAAENADITKVQELLGHRHVTTQIYDKRRRQGSDSASHDIPL